MLRLVLLRILETYFRHRFLYLLPILLMAIVGAITFALEKPTYIARGVVHVRSEAFLTTLTDLQEVGFGWVTPAKATVTEFEELLKTDAFKRSIIMQTNLEEQMGEGSIAIGQTFAEVSEAVWVTVLGDQMIMVGAAHEDPAVSQQLVQATIATFIQWKINADRDESVSAEDFFISLIDVYQANLDVARAELQFYLEGHPEPLRGDRPELERIEIDRLQAEINLAEKRLTNALERQENSSLAVEQAESAVRQTYLVIDTPNFPTEAANSRTSALINVIILVVVGVVMSIVGVLGAALLDRSHRFAIDVRHTLELPVLTIVPKGQPLKTSEQGTG